jgi:hypothetical protein
MGTMPTPSEPRLPRKRRRTRAQRRALEHQEFLHRGHRWTKAEEFLLIEGVGVFGLDWFTRTLHRSLASVRSKAYRLYGAGGLGRGTYPLTRIARDTGYSVTQIRRAMRALAQKWKRLSSTGPYLVQEEQRDELLGWLRTDYWSKKHHLYACAWCGSCQVAHAWGGLCARCAARYTARLRRAGLPTGKRLASTVRALHLPGSEAEEILDLLAKGRALPARHLRKILCKFKGSCSTCAQQA